MKKLLSIILAATLAVTTVLPASTTLVHGAEKNSTSSVTWRIEDTTLYFEGTGAIEDYGWGSAPWYPYQWKITDIVIGSGINHIGNYAFYNFDQVNTVTVPANVKSLGTGVFAWCDGLSSVTLKGVKGIISTETFIGCEKLTTVTLSEGITEIEPYAFNQTPALEKITLPKSVKNVEPYAFDEHTVITCKDPKMVKMEGNGYKYLQKISYKVYRNYDYAYEVVELVNKERKAAGLSSLKLDPELTKYAMIRAGECAVQYSHVRPNGTAYNTLEPEPGMFSGENAYAYPVNPEAAMTGWMNSAGHRANILGSSHETIGVGCIKHDGVYYWVQIFGREYSGVSSAKKSNGTVTQTTAISLDAYTDYPDGKEVNFTPYISVSSTKLNVGKSMTAIVRVTNTGDNLTDTKLTNAGITWSSSNTDVATVSSSGKIKALKPGKTIIKAKMSHYTLKKTIKVPCGDNHDYEQTSLTKATTSKNGSIKYKCAVCGTTKTTTIRKIKSVKLSATSLTYNGKVRKPTVKVTNSKGKTISSKYYTVTYPEGRKKVGTYKVKIKFSGRYKGTVYRSFKINPPKTYVTDLDGKTKAIKVKWKKKTTQTSGYQIRYSTSSSFKTKYTKTIKVKGYKNSYKIIKGLKADKKYYVKVRTYKIVDGKTYYSSWSKKKSVRTN